MRSSTKSNLTPAQRRYGLLFDMIVLAMLGTLMFCSKMIMEAFPNIHLLGMLTMTYTLVFRVKALAAIYVYVFLNGLYAGFSPWWIPYLYIWTILWGITMLLPRKMPRWAAAIVYPLVCGLHGFAFGALYSPAHALMYGFDLQQTLVWIAAGLPWDLIHGVSNICVGLLVLPFSELLRMLRRKCLKR